MRKYLPIFSWLPGYNWKVFPSDLLAGAVMLIPQGMAYALKQFMTIHDAVEFYVHDHKTDNWSSNVLQTNIDKVYKRK